MGNRHSDAPGEEIQPPDSLDLEVEFVTFLSEILRTREALEKALIARKVFTSKTDRSAIGLSDLSIFKDGKIDNDICEQNNIEVNDRFDFVGYKLPPLLTMQQQLLLNAAIFEAGARLNEKYQHLMLQLNLRMTDPDGKGGHAIDQATTQLVNLKNRLQTTLAAAMKNLNGLGIDTENYMASDAFRKNMDERLARLREEKEARDFLRNAEMYLHSPERGWGDNVPKTVRLQLEQIQQARNDGDYVRHKNEFLNIGLSKQKRPWEFWRSPGSIRYFEEYHKDDKKTKPDPDLEQQLTKLFDPSKKSG